MRAANTNESFLKIGGNPVDIPGIYSIILLQLLGLAILYSASTITSQREYSDPYFILKKQTIWAGLAFFTFYIFLVLPYKILQKYAIVGMIGAIFLLGMVFVPGLGKSVDTHYGRNFNRWISIGGIVQFQPSEFAKIAIILYISNIMVKYRTSENPNLRFFAYPAIFTFFVIVLIMLEPAYGTAMEIVILIILLLFLDGFPIGKLIVVVLAITPLLVLLVSNVGYRKKRIDVWLNPYKYRFDEGHQSVSSFRSFMEGGLFGNPLSTGYSHRYLTYSHTDFVLATFVEDYGFVGFLVLSGLFLFLIFRLAMLLRRVTEPFGFLLGSGLLGIFIYQVIVNMFVVTGLLPITGISLPFLSYGGSSLLTVMISLGILLNITRSENLS